MGLEDNYGEVRTKVAREDNEGAEERESKRARGETYVEHNKRKARKSLKRQYRIYNRKETVFPADIGPGFYICNEENRRRVIESNSGHYIKTSKSENETIGGEKDETIDIV